MGSEQGHGMRGRRRNVMRQSLPRRDGPRARLRALATAVPAHALDQTEIAAEAGGLFPARIGELARLGTIYDNAGIQRRYSCLPLEAYRSPMEWKHRNALYLEHALDLLEDAARACLAEADCAAGEVDAVIAVSTTGLATPSLDAHLLNRLGLRADVERLPVFGLGCAGGVLGLARAAAIAQARPGSRVLLLVVELCALTFRRSDSSNANIVATALFGDGAVAVLVTTGESEGFAEIAHWGEHTWPDSLDVMGWSVENDGLGVIFSRLIPALVRRDLGAALDDYLARNGLTRADVDGWIAHPGGAKVLEALEEVLGARGDDLGSARGVLRDFGNMSAATVLFVLDRERRAGFRGRRVMVALGPGFTAAFATLEGSGARAPP